MSSGSYYRQTVSSSEQPYVGGQAVIEGVMMRAPRCMAVAVRRADGTIVVREDAWVSIWERWRFLRWPGLRGAVVLAESVYNGMQALSFAADQANVDSAHIDGPKVAAATVDDETNGNRETGDAAADDRRTPDGTRPDRTAVDELAPRSGSEPRISAAAPESPSDGSNTMAMVVSFALAMALFVGLPHLLAWGAGRATGAGSDVDSFGFHVLDGIFKLAIFVAYIAGISLIPEIRRVFQYHGAEHKVVNVYENGLPVTLENARRFTTFHARCGTSFVLFVLVLSIFMFAAIFPLIPKVSDVALLNHVAMIFIKIPLMLPLAGIAYEINRYAARHPTQWWVQLLVQPGRLMQRLTTREPDDDQLEIAVAAMRAALQRESALVDADAEAVRALPKGNVAVYRDFDEVVTAFPAPATAG